MGLLINIDNGGTLTDFCAVDGKRIYRTKTVTTPYDLSQCLFDGLAKLSLELYGDSDLERLMQNTEYIRYSTTQGTNALVERKGPRLGLLLNGIDPAQLTASPHAANMFEALVSGRFATLDLAAEETALEEVATRAINALAAQGASRIVVGASGPGGEAAERRLERLLLRRFPPHLLGALPVLYSHQLVSDADDIRRIWTAMFNAFLHPAMERFLYNADQRLRELKTRNRLLIFRNDGGASRIARTAAIKTYSSGPRGGAEASRAYALHYGFTRMIGVDIGGTTTDISLVENGQVEELAHGYIEGVATSLPLAAIDSVGVGGSSVIRSIAGRLQVGPESVGGAPGPACFGLGGTEATITDAVLVAGLLDPASFFGGGLVLDPVRAADAITVRVARPLGLDLDAAIRAVEEAWVDQVTSAVQNRLTPSEETVLAAFGGAGPLLICRIAERLGVRRVLIPGLAALLSAFGVSFSDLSHEVDEPLDSSDVDPITCARSRATTRLERAMFGEGVSMTDCRLDESHIDSDVEFGTARLRLRASLALPRDALVGQLGMPRPAARIAGMRRVLDVDGRKEHPLVQIVDQTDGATGHGPAILEDAYFTCRVDRGWLFEINTGGDILLVHGS
jgi:N-methylhydantoinase A